MKRDAKLDQSVCPYGEPPEIEIISDNDWTINGDPRFDGDPDCQIVIAAHNACSSCNLNPANAPSRDDDDGPSAMLAYICDLENTLIAGIPLGNFTLTRLERRALIAIKGERNRIEIQRMKKSNQR